MAEAERQRLAMEGIGAAEALKAKLLAEAEGTKAKLLAEAEGTRAKLLAEAEGIRPSCWPRPRAPRRRRQAFEQLDASARAMLVLERLPRRDQAFAPVAGAVAAPMGNIDKLVMIDGGGGAAAARRCSASPTTVPTTLFQLIQTAQSMGLDLSGVLGALAKPATEGAAADTAEAVAPAAGPTVEAAGAVKDAAVATRETVEAAAGAAGSVADAVDRVVGAVRGTLPPRPPRV